MTVKETSAYLRIPLPTVYYLVQRGQLPAIQIGGRWRIKRSLLDKDVLKEDGGQPTVLVVDDDPALQTLFKQFLKKAGFGRIVVGTGAEALTYAEKQKFDLVFLDLKLPDIPGDELYVKLKEIDKNLPIVIITGYPDSEILTKILASGPVTVIKKPIEFDQLNQTVKILGHRGGGVGGRGKGAGIRRQESDGGHLRARCFGGGGMKTPPYSSRKVSVRWRICLARAWCWGSLIRFLVSSGSFSKS